MVAQEAACRSAPLLAPGASVHGTTRGAGDKFSSACTGPDDVHASPDRVFKIVMTAKARVRIAVEAPAWDPVLALRRTCLDGGPARVASATEVACNKGAGGAHHARVEAQLEPGTYYVVVDGHGAATTGRSPWTRILR